MLPYSKKVIQHFTNPKNFGKIKNASGIGHVGNSHCGDTMDIYIKVAKIDGKEIIKDIKFETLGCLPPDGEVLINEGDWEKISLLEEGGSVLNGSGRKAHVLETHIRQYSGQMFTIVPFVSTFNQFSLTGEHPVLCIKRNWLKSARRASKQCDWLRIKEEELLSKKPDYVPASELEVGDYLVFVPNKRVKDNQFFTEDMMRLIGYYLAEGYNAPSTVVNFALNKNEKENIAELKSLLSKVTEKNPGGRIRRNVIEIRICAKKWADFFESVAGRYATKKKLSDQLLILPPKKQWAMIQTYIKGDGSWYTRRHGDSPTCRITTASRNLAVQIQEILARNEIFSSIKVDNRPRDLIEGRKVRSHPLYEISFKLKRKNKFSHINKAKNFLVPIRKIEKKYYDGPVYNFQVNGKPNSYLVRGFAVHNCAAAIATSDMICDLVKGKTLDKALEVGYQDIVNELGELPAVKIHCSVLAHHGLRAAVEDYRKKL